MKVALFLFPLMAAVFARPDLPPPTGYTYNPPTIQTEPNVYPSISTNQGYDYEPPTFSKLKPTIAIDPPAVLPGLINERFDTNLHQDQRHVYFYAAPDNEQNARFRVYVQPSSRRNTKVIFIKAPGHGGIVPEVIAPPSQAEDKTLVYVLSKHQHQGGSVTIPSSLGVKQTKPEVHFVKYRNYQDVESAVSQGLVGQRVGTTLEDLGSAQVFTRNLGWRGGDQTGVTTVTGITNPTIDTRYGPPTIDIRSGAPTDYANK